MSAGSVSLASLTELLSEIRTDNGNHNGGVLRVGPDDKLWVGVGDTGLGDNTGGPGSATNPYAQDLASLNGKILRVNLDGTVPTDNPFSGTTGARGDNLGLRLPQPLPDELRQRDREALDRRRRGPDRRGDWHWRRRRQLQLAAVRGTPTGAAGLAPTVCGGHRRRAGLHVPAQRADVARALRHRWRVHRQRVRLHGRQLRVRASAPPAPSTARR